MLSRLEGARVGSRYGASLKSRSQLRGFLPVVCLAGRQSSEGGLGETSKTRFAIVGAGFAGLGVCWNLLRQLKEEQGLRHRGGKIEIDVYDAHGVGSGASAVAAGILHPLNTRGNVTWRGVEAMNETLALMKQIDRWRQEKLPNDGNEAILRQTGVLKVAKSEKDLERFERIKAERRGEIELHVVRGAEAATGRGDDCRGKAPGYMYTPHAYAVNSPKYLELLEGVCHSMAGEGRDVSLRLCKTLVPSLEMLEGQGYTTIIICAGAAVGTIKELRGKFPLRLSETFGVELETALSTKAVASPEDRGLLASIDCDPSLLGQTYVVKQPEDKAVLGAVHSEEQVDPEDALGSRYCHIADGLDDRAQVVNREKMMAMASRLLEKSDTIFPGLLQGYELSSVHCGVRALPPKSEEGRLPVCGKINDKTWYLLGLGARGLLYHAYLSKRLVDAILVEDESKLPQEVTRLTREGETGGRE
ncbi:FAD-dependent oxidoreductase [Chloropicon primus]|uniref:FAD-dependent oxidoreductase n=1 Tax=Chloropicon primus TaxID=1764295 RepID=A0A5B8MZV0_9CHLO|nr:FAD-dependent oxidoreductase [Chloropicon primus]UPR04193.1 FAD-dependent oxidoreductase [Chloropicon primus]|mmetsp:Transcript_5345/g.16152  ORF Transcript_5345/g.16152 Transcript_5345/m.16152 type:complete len:474 (+) Transcript_5345:104-1525(+)|eukprot:QDZ24984.1 FAD-dependent oxidoreductase [Chloropicon primus]